jgi:hypothetical protein
VKKPQLVDSAFRELSKDWHREKKILRTHQKKFKKLQHALEKKGKNARISIKHDAPRLYSLLVLFSNLNLDMLFRSWI